MPKRSIPFIAVVLLTLVGLTGIAQANFAIHGGYLADTDACAGCHRAHTATSAVTWIATTGARRSALLAGPPTTQVHIFCYVCHSSGAPGAATDVEGGVLDSTSPGGAVEGANAADMSGINKTLNGGGFELLGNDLGRPSTSTHEMRGAAWQAWGKDLNIAGYIFMDCCSCHDPHGSSNYRILKDYVNGHWVGGYSTSTTPVSSGSGTAANIGGVDPDPLPFVVSSEEGYPLRGKRAPASTGSGAHTGGGADSSIASVPTHGFRLHRQYNNGDLIVGNYNGGYEYIPSYTMARYARGYFYDNEVESIDRGMSAWCCACHENYMAGSQVSGYGDGATSVSKWVINGPGSPGSLTPQGWGPTSVLTTTLAMAAMPDDLVIQVNDASGFPDPWSVAIWTGDPLEWEGTTRNEGIQETKYIGIWGDGDQVMTNEGPIAIPKFEIAAYRDIIGNTFVVPPGGRGSFDTAQQAFQAGSKVFLGYDASDGYGDLPRHRHPMNVAFSKWQDQLYSVTYVAGDRALVLRPNDWQAFEGDIVQVDIPLDHNPFTEQTLIDGNYDNLGWDAHDPADPVDTNTDKDYFGANNIDDWIECLTCHRAHGTDATMSGFAGATLQPALIEAFNTLVPDPGTDDGVPPTGDSALLRADNRGVCERCHNK